MYSPGKPGDVRPPAEPRPHPNQPPAWKRSSVWHPLTERHRWVWSEMIHSFEGLVPNISIKSCCHQSRPSIWFLIIIVVERMCRSVSSSQLPLPPQSVELRSPVSVLCCHRAWMLATQPTALHMGNCLVLKEYMWLEHNIALMYCNCTGSLSSLSL